MADTDLISSLLGWHAMTDDDNPRTRDDPDDEQERQPLATQSSTYKILGELADTEASGVVGNATATSTVTYGVLGKGASPSTQGVVGAATSAVVPDIAIGYPAGMWGYTDRDSSTSEDVEEAYGVYGEARSTSGKSHGVYGNTTSSNGYGVFSDGDSKTSGDHEITGSQTVGNNHTVTGSQSIGKVGMEAEMSTNAQSIDSGDQPTIKFDTAVVDHFNQFDSANYEYVVPEDGHYHVVAAVHWRNIPGQSRHDVDIKVGNFSQVDRIQTVPGSSSEYATITDETTKTLYGLSQDDRISVSVFQDSGSPVDVTDGGSYFIVNKIG
jgi:hypothetical protein